MLRGEKYITLGECMHKEVKPFLEMVRMWVVSNCNCRVSLYLFVAMVLCIYMGMPTQKKRASKYIYCIRFSAV